MRHFSINFSNDKVPVNLPCDENEIGSKLHRLLRAKSCVYFKFPKSENFELLQTPLQLSSPVFDPFSKSSQNQNFASSTLILHC